MDGFIKMVRVAPIRINQRVQEGVMLKRMLQRNAERKNEKTLLDFLEGCFCGVVNSISKDNGKGNVYRTGYLYCCDI